MAEENRGILHKTEAARGIKGLTLAPGSLYSVHELLIEHIKNGAVTSIEDESAKGRISRALSTRLMGRPITLRSHGGRIPVVVDDVVVVSTPDESIGILVTDHGIAEDPLRQAPIGRLKETNLALKTIGELHDIACSITGKPRRPEFTDKVIALIEYRDGTLIDVLWEVVPVV